MFDLATKYWLLGGLGIFGVIIIFITYLASRGIETADDFNVAGRDINRFSMVLTLVGTHMGGSAMLGYMQHGYAGGIGRIFEVIPMMIVMYLITIFLLVPIRNVGDKYKMVTLPDFTVLRYGTATRLPAVLSILCAYCAITGVQFIAIGAFLKLIFGINLQLAICIGWAFLSIYTYAGGLKAVIYSDTFTGTLQSIGMIFIFILVYIKSGGYGPMNELASSMGNPELSNWFSISRKELLIYTFTIGGYQIVRQDVWQRIWASRTTRIARNSNWIAVTGFLVLSVAIYSAGALARINLGIQIENSAMIFYAVVIRYLTRPFLTLMVVCLMATIVSCGDSFLISGGSTIANDIIKPMIKVDVNTKMLKYSRYSSLIMGTIGLFGALYIQDLILLWVTGTAMLVSGLVAPVVAGFFWKKATNLGGLVSMWGGLITAVIWQFSGQPFGLHPIFVGFPVSIVLLIVVSLLTKPSNPEIVENLHYSNNKAILDE